MMCFALAFNLFRPLKRNRLEGQAIADINTAVDSMYATCRANNIKLLVVFHPVQWEFKGPTDALNTGH
jgi:hypothetical protein